MTWLGWLLVGDLAVSTAVFIAGNDNRRPLTRHQVAAKVVVHILYIVGLLAIGSGSL